jgi:hypothetical protein
MSSVSLPGLVPEGGDGPAQVRVQDPRPLAVTPSPQAAGANPNLLSPPSVPSLKPGLERLGTAVVVERVPSMLPLSPASHKLLDARRAFDRRTSTRYIPSDHYFDLWVAIFTFIFTYAELVLEIFLLVRGCDLPVCLFSVNCLACQRVSCLWICVFSYLIVDRLLQHETAHFLLRDGGVSWSQCAHVDMF